MKNTIINIFFILVISLVNISVKAANITLQSAHDYALSFMQDKKGISINEKTVRTADNAPDGLYIFNFGDKEGFVILSSKTENPVLLGYNTIGEYKTNNIPENAKNWLKYYATSDISLYNSKNDYNSEVLKATTTATEVQPLITATWAQMSPYNSECPTNESNGDAVCGCVPVAMAQVMRYYKYPQCGTESISYYDSLYGNISVDFASTCYDWANMPDKLDSTSSDVQINAVATLIYQCAAATMVDFGNKYQGTGTRLVILKDYPTGNAQYALFTYFGYDQNMTAVGQSQYTSNQWKKLMKRELSAGRPVLYSGTDKTVTSGHCFIMDGYDSNNYFHFNWGWDGDVNGYFLLDSLIPYASTKDTLDYSHNQVALIGITPPTGAGISSTQTNSQPISYPNPVTDDLKLNLQASAVVRIIATDGRVLYKGRLNNNNNCINVSDYPAGLYILSVQTADGNHREIIVKQ